MKRVTITFEFDSSKDEAIFRKRLFELAQIMKAKFKRYERKGVKSGNSSFLNSNVGAAVGGFKSV